MKQPAHSRQRDAELIAQIAVRDERALSELGRCYGEQMFRYALRLIKDATIAEELINDVLLEVWYTADNFRGASRLSTWLLGITRFKAINAVRGKRLQWVDNQILNEVPDDLYEIERDLQTVERKKRIRVIRAAMLELSAEHREVLDLTFFHDCSYAEIAQIVGVPAATVRTRMHYAKVRLRQALHTLDMRLSADLLG